MAAKKKLSIEESMKRLDEITAEMEKPGVSLEDSFKLFNEGVGLVAQCRADLTGVEKKIKVLEMANGDVTEAGEGDE